MTWQTIASSEVDANSPLSTTLMSKIKNDLNYLYLQKLNFKPTLFNNSDTPDDELSKELESNYTNVLSISIVVPNGISRMKVAVKMKTTGTGTRTAKATADIYSSDEHTFTTGNYELFTLVFSAVSAGIQTLNIQAKSTNPGDDAYMGWAIAWVEYD